MRTSRFLNTRQGLLAVAALLVIVALVTLTIPSAPGVSAPAQMSTMDPTIVSNLTRIPNATPLPVEESSEWRAFQQNVLACNDYSTRRKTQMVRYIEWLINPAQIPPDLIVLFGNNTSAGLIRAMALDTETEWRLKQRPKESCLVTVGRQLNDMLIATDQEPIPIYDQS